MNTFIIEIHPKKPAFDPLARSVRSELIEAGEFPEEAVVSTQRLYKISGPLTADQAVTVAESLLVDPVVETANVYDLGQKSSKKKNGKKGTTVPKGTNIPWRVDVWPKTGVTDPVGETVEKGLRDLGHKGNFHAHSAVRYVFPKIKNSEILKNLAQKVLANEMIHDITITREPVGS